MSTDISPDEFERLLSGPGFSELYFEEFSSLSVHYEDGRVEDIDTGSGRGTGLRRILKEGGGWRTRYAGADSWACDEIAEMSRRIAAGPAAQSRLGFDWKLRSFDASPAVPPSTIPLDEKVGLLKKADEAVRNGFEHIRQVSLSYGEKKATFFLMDSTGNFVSETRTAVIFAAHVTAEDGSTVQTGQETAGGLGGWEIFSARDPAACALLAGRRAVEKLSAPAAAAGEMPVVISGLAGGTLIHEAIGHSLEADHVQDGISPAYAGKLGRRVAPEWITITDDPTIAGLRGSFNFDDEGVKSSPTVLVENGVLKNYLYDRLTAMREGKQSNGHGRRESYHHKPAPRMSNLYIAPGKQSPESILRSLDRGLFVTRMGGGQVNTATGEFVFEVDEGYAVENGKILHRVRDATLLGEGPATLESMEMPGTDLGWAIGSCGKDGQSVPVADGLPTIKIRKILVGGKQ